MNEEEKEKYYKLAIEIGEIIGKYGNNEQIELFQKILNDYKTKSSEYFKLQKENEMLKSENNSYAEIVERDYIDKDEIKQLIGYEGNEDISKGEIIAELKTMWEEFNRLEDIEDKMWEEFNRLEDIEDFTATQCISKKKIKAKIKELEEKDESSPTRIYGYGIKFLKELLNS